MPDRTRATRLMILVTILAAAFLAGCAAKKPAVPRAEEGLVMEYRMPQGKTLRYEIGQYVSQNMEIMGQQINAEVRKGYEITLQSKGLQGGNHLVGVTIDSMHGSIDSPQGEYQADVQSAVGKSFDMVLSRYGKELDVSEAQDIEYGIGAMGTRSIKPDFMTLFPDLPGKSIKIGDSWVSRDSIAVEESGTDVLVATESLNTLEGFETLNGMKCAKVSAAVTGTFGGTGEQMGTALTFDGTVEGTEVWYFAYEEGILVKSESNLLTEATVTASGPEELTIPMSQRTNTETSLLQ